MECITRMQFREVKRGKDVKRQKQKCLEQEGR